LPRDQVILIYQVFFSLNDKRQQKLGSSKVELTESSKKIKLKTIN